MKFVPGGVQEVAQESITSMMLMDAGMGNPDYLPTIMRLYRDNSPLNYILDVKGLKTKGLHVNTNNQSYNTVGSNHVKYRIAETEARLEHIRANAGGVTFIDQLGSLTKPGQNQSLVEIFTDSNWGGFQEIIELADNRTQLYIILDPEEVEDGVWKTTVKLWTNDRTEFINPDLLVDGMEFQVVTNAHEQDFSERGVEKYQFKTWGDAYLTLQRFKYSWSGTAAAIIKNKKTVAGRFVVGGGEKAFLTKAEDDMMRRAAQQLNYMHIYGKSTVTTEGKTIVKNWKGRDVMAGDGLLNSNGGPVDIFYNGWTVEFIEFLMNEIDQYVLADSNSKYEVVMLMAPKAYTSFQMLMRRLGTTMNSNIVGDGASKGMIDTYAFYEFGGIRLIPMKEPSMTLRPAIKLADGSDHNDMDVILVPLGLASDGSNGVQLVQLRPQSEGVVAGIDKGGNIASSVDGSSKHVLFQNGIINQNKIFYLKKPFIAGKNI